MASQINKVSSHWSHPWTLLPFPYPPWLLYPSLFFRYPSTLIPLFYLMTTITPKTLPLSLTLLPTEESDSSCWHSNMPIFEYGVFRYSNMIPTHFPPLSLSIQQTMLFPLFGLFPHSSMNIQSILIQVSFSFLTLQSNAFVLRTLISPAPSLPSPFCCFPTRL